jgi:hypothetical protein
MCYQEFLFSFYLQAQSISTVLVAEAGIRTGSIGR